MTRPLPSTRWKRLDDIVRYPLFRDPYLLLVPKNLGADCRDQDLREILSRHHLIRHSARSHSGTHVERHLRRLGLEPPRMLEFDTSDSLVAMVATGVGVAITTPLCLLQGAAFVDDVEVLPLPGPGFSRQLTFVTRRDEFSPLGRVAEPPATSSGQEPCHASSSCPMLEPRMEWMTLDLTAMKLNGSSEGGLAVWCRGYAATTLRCLIGLPPRSPRRA